jgi:non-ribosomal peptide synthetase component E (peptide arylation enzyme)
VVTQFPLSPVGKILKRELRDAMPRGSTPKPSV